MTTQLLIYETAVPVSSGRHAKCSVETDKRYAFTRQVNSVPLMAVEFPEASTEYAIVFAASGLDIVPLVILGARQNENLYLTDGDEWRAKYVPAFVRRYPFVFSSSEDGQTFTLCVDEAYPGLNYLGKGQALFTAEGKPTSYTEAVLKFLQEYRAQFVRTQAFCKKLKDLDLFEPMQAQFTLGSGEKMSLTGFMVVDRKKLKALGGEKLADLAATDELELLYLHLNSMRNFNWVKDRLVESDLLKPNAAAPAAVADEPGAVEEAVMADAEPQMPAAGSRSRKK